MFNKKKLIEKIVNTPSRCLDILSSDGVKEDIKYGCAFRQNEIIDIINEFTEECKSGKEEMKTTVFCKTHFEGVHCYPEAPGEVIYLRNSHRHIFNVKVVVEVFDDDREIEFIMLKHVVNEWLRSHCNSRGVWNMGTLSCEQVAIRLIEILRARYDTPERTRQYIVTIDEDGENGATVYGD